MNSKNLFKSKNVNLFFAKKSRAHKVKPCVIFNLKSEYIKEKGVNALCINGNSKRYLLAFNLNLNLIAENDVCII